MGYNIFTYMVHIIEYLYRHTTIQTIHRTFNINKKILSHEIDARRRLSLRVSNLSNRYSMHNNHRHAFIRIPRCVRASIQVHGSHLLDLFSHVRWMANGSTNCFITAELLLWLRDFLIDLYAYVLLRSI